MQYLSVAIVCLAALASAAPPPIVVGNDTTTQYTFLVSLQKFGNHVCGGTLIDNQTVLTAVHCLPADDAEYVNYTVVVGNNVLADAKPSDVFRLKRAFKPAGPFEPKRDIALLQLSKPVPQSENVSFAQIHTNINYRIGALVVEVGWGRTAPGAPAAKVLRDANTFIVDKPQACSTEKGLVCLDARACSGDSGSPLVYKTANGTMLVVGIAQAVTVNGPCFQPAPSPNAYDLYVRFDSDAFKTTFANLLNARAKSANRALPPIVEV